MSGTRYEWILVDLAVMCAGAATTSVYPSAMTTDVAYILTDSQSHVVVAEDRSQAAKLRGRRGVHWVVLIDGEPTDDERDRVVGLAERARRGWSCWPRNRTSSPIGSPGPTERLRDAHVHVWDDRASQGCAAVAFGLGVRGGAVVALGILRLDDVQLLWLPLSHSFAKVLLTAQLAVGFATAVDGRVDKIVENMAEIRPTFMGAAPRIFEKAHARMVTTVAAKGRDKARLFAWAVAVGRATSEIRLAAQHVGPCSRRRIGSPMRWC